MKKKSILTAALFLVITAASVQVCLADDTAALKEEITKTETVQPPQEGEHFAPPQRGDLPEARPEFGKHQPPQDMEAEKAKLEKRLKLTDKQKKKIEEQQKQDREKIKPVLDDIKAKREQFRVIDEDKSLSAFEKEQKKQALRSEMRELKGKAETLRKDNMKNFESILTNKQKKEFAKIKKERKAEMEKNKKKFDKKGGPEKFGPKGPHNFHDGFMPPEPPLVDESEK